MKKVIRVALLSMLVCAMFCTIALAYGTATFEENGVTYTAVDRANVYFEGSQNDTLCVYATCEINPKIKHYSTADIRIGSKEGFVVASSGRKWSETSTSTAFVSTPRTNNLLKGFGWWGH